MKATILLALLGAALVGAQDITVPADTISCISGCWDSMRNLIGLPAEANPTINKFESCPAKDVTCACKLPDFGYGVRDCSRAQCDTLEEVNAAIKLANDKCSTNLADDTTFIPHPTATGAPGATGVATPTAITTSSFTTVVISGSFTSTIQVTTTVSGVDGTPVAPGGSPAQTTGAPPATTTDGAAATTDTPAGSADATTTATDSEGNASTGTSSGLGAQVTAAPMAGLLAAAGLIAALL